MTIFVVFFFQNAIIERGGDIWNWPSEAELLDPELACKLLWELDNNRLQVNKHVKLKRGTTQIFEMVDQRKLTTPSFKSLMELLCIYNKATTTADEKRHGQDMFLATILDTDVMAYLFNFMKESDLVRNLTEFEDKIETLWFKLDSGDRSSLFRHYFVGEKHGTKVTGMHDWVQPFLLESRGQMRYYKTSNLEVQLQA